MSNIVKEVVKPKHTVQFLPKDLFKVISSKYRTSHAYNSCISGYPYGVKVQPITIRNQTFAVGLHKDNHLCQFFLFTESQPFIPGEKKIIDNKKIAFTIYGGKISSHGLGTRYNNKLYYKGDTVAYQEGESNGFDPAFAISVVMGEMALINLANLSPMELKIDVKFLKEIKPYDLPVGIRSESHAY